MDIRAINEEDAGNLSALSIFVWLNTYAKNGIRDNISNFVLNEFNQERFKKIANSIEKEAFIAICDQHVVGMVIIDLGSKYEGSQDFGSEIETLYVHPNFQRRGIGKLLLNHLKENVTEKSWLKTWVHNTSAIMFYEQNGFKIVGKAEFNLLNEVHINHVLSNR